MSDHDLLHRLGRAAREREEREHDPLLDALVAGEATPAQRAELEASAAADTDRARDVALHTPLDDALKARILSQALATAAATQGRSSDPGKRTAPPRRLHTVTAGAALAAAAALLLMFWRTPGPEALPAYSLSAHGGLEDVRGAAQREVVRVEPETRLELVMRPEGDVQGEVELRVLERMAGEVRVLDADVQRSPAGTLRIVESARQLFGERLGRRALSLIACRPALCDEAERAVRRGPSSSEGAATVREIEISYER